VAAGHERLDLVVDLVQLVEQLALDGLNRVFDLAGREELPRNQCPGPGEWETSRIHPAHSDDRVRR
jgi:hypothetical protein